jgi:hypothetical protein
MSIEQQKQWLTARESARILRVTERMIGHYADQNKLRTRREGRRVWYLAEDVEKLARDLRADLRQLQTTRQDVNEELAGYIRERKETDRQFLETQADISERVRRIEERVNQPFPRQSGINWQTVALVFGVILLLIGAFFLYKFLF